MNWRTINNLRDIMIQTAKRVFGNAIDFKVSVWARAFILSMAEGIYSVQSVFKNAFRQLFPQWAKGEFLEMWGDWENLPIKDAEPGEGTVNFIGNGAVSEGLAIPIDTQVQASDGLVYIATEAGTIVKIELTVSVSIVDGVATVTCTTDHNFASGQSPVLTLVGLGVVTAEDITVISDTVFTFSTDEGNTSDSGDCVEYQAQVEVECESTGEATNQTAGSEVVLVEEITNIKNTAFVFEDFSGGVDEEEQETYRARIMSSRAQMRGVFTDDQNTTAGLRIAGNTRIFIDPPEVGTDDTPKVAGFQPRPGEAVFYIIRDLSDGSIESPVSADILAETKEAIVEYGKLPSHMSEDDVYCFSPLLYDVDFELEISPDTTAMRQAVNDSLDAFFEDNAEFDESPSLNSVISAIERTPELESFTMNQPTSIVVTSKHIPQKGTVSFV